LRLLAFTAETISLAGGDILYRAGEVSDCGYVLMTGAVSVPPGVEGGGPSIVTAPALLGETALIVETKRPGTVTASEPATLLKIPRHLFLRVMREFPAGASRLRAFLGGRLTDFVGELEKAREKAELRVHQ
ncbi:MAG: cyclic nucleotide-binding domain-containing protein, partial [Beijerinckiaceae bacterium]